MKKLSKNEKDPMEVLGCARGHTHEELIQNLPRHKDFSPVLIRQIKRIPEVVLRNSGTPLAKKINRMMREVSTESYRAIQFTRTEINNRGVLYGVVLLKHRVIDLVLKYLHKRFPESIICLYNEHTKKTTSMDEKGNIFVSKSSLNKVVEKFSENRPLVPFFEDINFTCEQIFETLYKSQFIPERENPRYFKTLIPKKCYNLPGMRNGIEKRYIEKRQTVKTKTIDDFC
ncbi:hypothetical protein LCGC14_2924170 [marine sediment metagenome]|uniref:DUF4130 domain-containing protein n=1 Tax=marine sediment metagenome TaxID=412755 RepID=A0A0F8Y9Q9_9ZZZZ